MRVSTSCCSRETLCRSVRFSHPHLNCRRINSPYPGKKPHKARPHRGRETQRRRAGPPLDRRGRPIERIAVSPEGAHVRRSDVIRRASPRGSVRQHVRYLDPPSPCDPPRAPLCLVQRIKRAVAIASRFQHEFTRAFPFAPRASPVAPASNKRATPSWCLRAPPAAVT